MHTDYEMMWQAFQRIRESLMDGKNIDIQDVCLMMSISDLFISMAK